MGAEYEVADIPAELTNEVQEWRDKMLESAANYDDEVMEKFFEDPSTITEEEILRAIRKGTLKHEIIPMTYEIGRAHV